MEWSIKMYEEITYNTILTRMLERVDNRFDKREGSIIMTAIAPIAMEIYLAYFELDKIINESFADTQSRDFLSLRARERGIEPKEASPSRWIIESDVKLKDNMRFAVGEYSFYVDKVVDDTISEVVCEQSGSKTNLLSGDVIPLQHIEDLHSVSLVELAVAGEDEEETESFRSRYFDFLQSAPFGGNVADYKEKAMSMDGVGNVKVVPLWDGPGTVKIIFTSSDNKSPSNALVESMQNIFDPQEGNGIGLAPIGHKCTVVAANELSVNLTTEITTTSEVSITSVENILDDYFDELTRKWVGETSVVVRVNQIESRILEIDGVSDVSATTINGNTSVLVLNSDTIPVRGTVNASII